MHKGDLVNRNFVLQKRAVQGATKLHKGGQNSFRNLAIVVGRLPTDSSQWSSANGEMVVIRELVDKRW